MRELIVDSFAGGGGASHAIFAALGRYPDIAINHDREALAMHRANHPGTRHYCEDVWKVDPREATRGQPVGLFWISPDCKHHSKAKGGKPRENKIRALASVAIYWAKTVRPRVIFLENVEEFVDWGPLLEDGTPNAFKKGFSFRRWCAQLRNLGYDIDMRELQACDYGAGTTRNRLFLVARCDGQPIIWPDRTHGPGLEPYVTAADCIDWSDLGTSIFERKRPLVDNTLRRVARGIMRHVVNDPNPFIVTLRGTEGSHLDGSARPLTEPLRTVSAQGNHFAACHTLLAPYIAGCGGRMGQSPERRADRPAQTFTTKGDSVLCSPVLVNTRNGERKATETARGQKPRVRSMREPHPTVTAQGSQGAIATAFLAKNYGGNENDGTKMGRPVDTITARDHHSLVAALLLKYYGTDQNPNLRDPLATVTTKDRFALVTVRSEQYYIADILFRMLKPRELFLAQGFPPDYIIDYGIDEDGSRIDLTASAQTRMCGNSVSPPPATAMIRANYGLVAARKFADGRLF